MTREDVIDVPVGLFVAMLVVMAVLFLVLMIAVTGKEGMVWGRCYRNRTCDEGLVCFVSKDTSRNGKCVPKGVGQ